MAQEEMEPLVLVILEEPGELETLVLEVREEEQTRLERAMKKEAVEAVEAQKTLLEETEAHPVAEAVEAEEQLPELEQ